VKTILCYGDSNTWGMVPMTTLMSASRHAPSDRWPRVMQRELGPAYVIIEAGLNLLREDGAYGPLKDQNVNPVTIPNPDGGPDVQVESILNLNDPNTRIYEVRDAVTSLAAHSDDDNDGLSDVDEASIGTDPLDADSDDDGITDYNENPYGGIRNSNPAADTK
jgi:Bacterial TSP3 repeat